MKNITKLLILLAASVIATTSFAQIFGLKAGLNLANISYTDEYDLDEDFKLNPGFHAGPTVEFPISSVFSFETGLILSTKGTKQHDEIETPDGTFSYEDKLNLLYLDIPLTTKATFNVGSAKLYGLFGPYIGVGIAGKSKYEYSFQGETETGEESVEWGSDEIEHDLRRHDFGLVIGTGILIKSLEIGISYNFGLANIVPSSSTDDFSVKNRVIGVSVGYKFGETEKISEPIN